jgi:hypothetical protein
MRGEGRGGAERATHLRLGHRLVYPTDHHASPRHFKGPEGRVQYPQSRRYLAPCLPLDHTSRG